MAKEVNINLKTVGGQDLIGTGDIELQELQSSDSIEIVNGQAQRKALTGDVTASENGNTTTIADSAVTTPKIADDNVTLQKLQKIASNVILGNNGGTADNPKELTTAEVIAMLGLGTVFTPKGSVTTYGNLPSSGNNVGDVWNVLDGEGVINDGENVVWNGTAWDNFGGTVDLSAYLVKSTTPLTVYGVDDQGGQLMIPFDYVLQDLNNVLDNNNVSSGHDIRMTSGDKLMALSNNDNFIDLCDIDEDIKINASQKLYQAAGLRRLVKTYGNDLTINRSDNVIMLQNDINCTLPKAPLVGDTYTIIALTNNSELIFNTSTQKLYKSGQLIPSFKLLPIQPITIMCIDLETWVLTTNL